MLAQKAPALENYVTPEEWRSVGSKRPTHVRSPKMRLVEVQMRMLETISCVFPGCRFPVSNAASSAGTRCVCQHKQLVCGVILGLISLLVDVGKCSLKALALRVSPQSTQSSGTGLKFGAKTLLPDAPLWVTKEHNGLEDVCDGLAGLTRSPPPPSAPPAPPSSSSGPTSTGGENPHTSTEITGIAVQICSPTAKPAPSQVSTRLQSWTQVSVATALLTMSTSPSVVNQ